MSNAHTLPLHRVACCLWDHHFPLPALPWALVCAKLPLPLSSSKLQALFALGFPRVSQDGCTCPLMSLFHWITEEGEGFAVRGLAVSRAPLPTGSLWAFEPASFWHDPPLRVRPAEDGPILLVAGICFRSPTITLMIFCCAISLCLLGD